MPSRTMRKKWKHFPKVQKLVRPKALPNNHQRSSAKKTHEKTLEKHTIKITVKKTQKNQKRSKASSEKPFAAIAGKARPKMPSTGISAKAHALGAAVLMRRDSSYGFHFFIAFGPWIYIYIYSFCLMLAFCGPRCSSFSLSFRLCFLVLLGRALRPEESFCMSL